MVICFSCWHRGSLSSMPSFICTMYIRNAHLDVVHSFSLKRVYFINVQYHLQWQNIDNIKEFNWNFENLEV